MIQAFVEIWQNLDLFGAPILAGMLVALALGMLSPFVVQRHMAMAVAAVTQSAGAAVTLAFLIAGLVPAIPIEPLAVVFVLAVAGWLFRERRHDGHSDTRIALVFVLSIAISLLVRAYLVVEAHEIDAILFGTAVLVSDTNLLWLAVVVVPAVIWVLWWFRGLRFALFDPVTASVHGLPVSLLRTYFGLVLALLLALGSRTVGVLPSMAYAILPGLLAGALGINLRFMVWLSGILAVLGSFGGYVLAYWLDVPVGPVQACLLGAVAAGVFGLRYR